MLSQNVTHRRVSLAFALVMMIFTPLLMAPSCAPPIIVHAGESIQDAVDAASPGDTILVLPGIYTGTPGDESVVDVQKSGITITGSENANHRFYCNTVQQHQVIQYPLTVVQIH